MIKNLLLTLFCFAVPFAGLADNVSADEANSAAMRFFSHSAGKLKYADNLPLKPVAVQTAADGDAPALYVFNRGDNQGFVIISGEDSVNPVLAYSYEGSFSVGNMPDNLKGWMANVEGEIARVRSMNPEEVREFSESRSSVFATGKSVKLATPDWNQSFPYNNLCPEYYPGYRCYTGCAITATAIVMGYHRWPDSGTGTFKGYTSNAATVPGVTLGHPYEWSKMPFLGENGLDESNPGEGDAVATLMRDLGVMVRANYDYSETGASVYTVSVKLPRHMKYRDCMFYAQGSMFSEGEWATLLKDELDASRPIVYVGYTPDGRTGHAFVLDGYDENGLFSVNWGWGGTSNGYYMLHSLNPGDQGIGGTSGNGFSNTPEALLLAMPNRPGEDIEHFERFRFTLTNYVKTGLQLNDPNQKIEQGTPFEITAGRFMNLGTDRYVGETKLVLTDKNGNIKQELYTTPERDMAPGIAIMPLDELRDHFTVTLENPIAAGDRIRFVYKSGDGWKPVLCTEPDGQWEIVLKEDSDRPTGADLNAADRISVTGRNGIIHISGTVPGTPVAVYNLYGQPVYHAESASETMQIPLPEGYFYIVRAGDRSFRVKL